jgi:hypothetical protein
MCTPFLKKCNLEAWFISIIQSWAREVCAGYCSLHQIDYISFEIGCYCKLGKGDLRLMVNVGKSIVSRTDFSSPTAYTTFGSVHLIIRHSLVLCTLIKEVKGEGGWLPKNKGWCT